MTDKKYKEDRDFAKRRCKALRKGQKEDIVKVYHRFHLQFLSFCQKRLYTFSADYEQEASSVMIDYWIELMNGDYICKYQGKGSLEKYLRWRLNDRIKNKIRQINQLKKATEGPPQSPVENPEEKLITKEIKKRFNESLLALKEKFPYDAYYIAMYLEGKTYEEMARHELACENPDEAMIGKKTNAIKVQFTRKKTGSLARFKRILERKMDEYGIDIRDLLAAIKKKRKG